MESIVSTILRLYLSLLILIPENNIFMKEEYDSLIKGVNEEQVRAEEQLSDHLYYYCTKDGKLTV